MFVTAVAGGATPGAHPSTVWGGRGELRPPVRCDPPRYLDADTNLPLARQRSHCSFLFYETTIDITECLLGVHTLLGQTGDARLMATTV